MTAYISGIGWVYPDTSGNKNNTVYHENHAKRGLPKLTRKDVLEKPYKPFGRMDYFSKLGFAAITYAVKDAGLDKKGSCENTSMIASSLLGCLGTDFDYYKTIIPEKGSIASPALFAYTLPNCFLGEASIYYGFTGESFVINEDTSNGLSGLFMAIDLLETNESDFVLCGVCDAGMPDIEGLEADFMPGSLFFVLEKEKRAGIFYYGEIKESDKNKEVLYNGEVISDLADLYKKILI